MVQEIPKQILGSLDEFKEAMENSVKAAAGTIFIELIIELLLKVNKKKMLNILRSL